MKLESIRREYIGAALHKGNIEKNPYAQFEKWMAEALKVNPEGATSVGLCTNGIDGFPESRIVLLKGYSTSGFEFYTNYNSSKGKDIEADNRVSLHFFWPELERQIRIWGYAEKLSYTQSEAYFHSRPLDSQIAAVISEQSAEVPSRKYLEEKFDATKAALKGKAPDCPENWGGFRVIPVKFEFWQGRENRLHDRLIFEKANDEWSIKRLAP